MPSIAVRTPAWVVLTVRLNQSMTDPLVPDDVALDDLVAGCAASHQRILTWLDALDPDPGTPSLLPDWTVGHIVTHLARNADAFSGMLDGALADEVRPMYAGGWEQRTADIVAGASRSWSELVTDLRRAIWRVEGTWAQLDADSWKRAGSTMFGPLPVFYIPRRRWREVEVHRLDLGLGYTWRDLPDDLVRLDLPARRAAFTGVVPNAVTDLGSRAELAWLYARSVGPDTPAPPDWF